MNRITTNAIPWHSHVLLLPPFVLCFYLLSFLCLLQRAYNTSCWEESIVHTTTIIMVYIRNPIKKTDFRNRQISVMTTEDEWTPISRKKWEDGEDGRKNKEIWIHSRRRDPQGNLLLSDNAWRACIDFSYYHHHFKNRQKSDNFLAKW